MDPAPLTLDEWIALDPTTNRRRLVALIARINAYATQQRAARTAEIQRTWADCPDVFTAEYNARRNIEAAESRVSEMCEQVFAVAMWDAYGVTDASGAAATALLAQES